MSRRSSLYTLLLIFLLAGLAACQQGPSGPSVLENILANKKLIVATRYAPTTLYELHDEKTGFEYDMVESFAKSLDVEVEYLIKYSTSEILNAVESGEAHIAAAGLTKTEEREEKFLFGPIYQQAYQQVVCRRGGANPKTVEALVDIKLSVPAETSYAETLFKLQNGQQNTNWSSEGNGDTESLLESVWEKKLDCTVADSNIVAINRRYYPELKVRFNLSEAESLAWIMSVHADDLQTNVENWFEDFIDDGHLEALSDKYYGYIELFDYVDNKKFTKRINRRLPKYRKEFQKAAKKYKLDWTLLAAQAYQESHWNARAKSPTGVRGIMMLTLTTAKAMGIKSRLDPKQSIQGGAKYLSKLLKRIPESVQEPDRTWYALAAYNVGMGHIHDARTLAKRLGKNPDLWRELSEVLPLLSKKKYYKTLKYGYARGKEPVTYVQRIRDYHNILQQTINVSSAK